MQINSQMKQREQLEAQISELDKEHETLSSNLKNLRGGNEPLKQEYSRVEAELKRLHAAHEQEDSTARQKVRFLVVYSTVGVVGDPNQLGLVSCWYLKLLCSWVGSSQAGCCVGG